MQRATNLPRPALRIARARVDEGIGIERQHRAIAGRGLVEAGDARQVRLRQGFGGHYARRECALQGGERLLGGIEGRAGGGETLGARADRDGGGAHDEFTSVHGCSSLVLLGRTRGPQRNRPAPSG